MVDFGLRSSRSALALAALISLLPLSPQPLHAIDVATGAALHHLNTFVPVGGSGHRLSCDIDGDGRADVISAGSIHVHLASGAETFMETFTDGTHEYLWVAAGDFTGDGEIDLLATYVDPSGAQGVLFVGDGTGSFGIGLPVGTMPWIQYAVDVNGDDLTDAVGVPNGATLEVRLSLGGGLFAPPISSPVALDFPWELEGRFGDVDGDGYADLAQPADGAITIHHGSAGGAFTPGLSFPSGDLGNHGDTKVADLDGDGLLDLVHVMVHVGLDQLVIRRGLGDGTFALLGSMYFDDYGAFRIEIGDLDGDGTPEILVRSNAVNVFARQPAGSYQLVQRVAVGGALDDGWLADVHGDGIDDFIDPHGSGFQVIPGRNGRLSLPVAHDPPEFVPLLHPSDFQVVDLEGDGDPELLYGQRSPGAAELRLFEYHDGTFSAIGDAIPGYSAILGRFGSDPWLDLVATSIDSASQTLTLEVRAGDGAGHFAPGPATALPAAQFTAPLRVADLDGDGIHDLWSSNVIPGGDSEIRVLLCDAAGTLSALAPFTISGRTTDATDIDGDGTLDFYGVDEDDIAILLGDALGNWTASLVVPVMVGSGIVSPITVLAGDTDGDGDGDLLVSLVSTVTPIVTLRRLQNDGALGFTVLPDLDLPSGKAERLIDLDSDGDLDVVVGGGEILQFCTMEGGEWSKVERGGIGMHLEADFVDLDADGFADIVGPSAEGLVVILSGADCDDDAVRDRTQVISGLAEDCNENLRPDGCDLADGTSVDIDGDGTLDECLDDFVRGDIDESGKLDIADALRLLLHVTGLQITITDCPPAFDVNSDRQVDIADVVVIFEAAIGDAPPPPPFPDCGPGSPHDLECEEFDCP